MKNRKVTYILILFILPFYTLQAQVETGSPFSAYGIGELNSHNMVQNKSMGGAGIGYFSHLSINYNNPASYSELRLVNLNIGVENKNIQLEDKDQSQTFSTTNFDYFTLTSPVAKWIDISLGVMPFSTTNYGYKSKVKTPNAGQITYKNQGNGGLSNAYLGTGFKLDISETSSIALGANASYLFGKIYKEQRAIYEENNSYNILNQTYNYAGDFYFNYGLLYRKEIKICKKTDSIGNCVKSKKVNFSLGITYAPSTNISNEFNHIIQTYTGNENFETFKDTLLDNSRKANLKIPQMFGIGFMLASPNNKWLINVDYQLKQWSKTNTDNTVELLDESIIRAGMEITPNPISTKYWNTVSYRFGINYNTGYLKINSYPVKKYGITFGLGLPIHIKQQGAFTMSSVNIGFEIGKQGSIDKNLLTEYYGNIYFSLTINDKWFYKYKYD